MKEICRKMKVESIFHASRTADDFNTAVHHWLMRLSCGPTLWHGGWSSSPYNPEFHGRFQHCGKLEYFLGEENGVIDTLAWMDEEENGDFFPITKEIG